MMVDWNRLDWDESEDEYEYINNAEAIQETEKALLIQIGDDEEYWVPKSIIGRDSQIQEFGDQGVLSIKAWFVEKEMS